ncbi:MAG: restriction endonuclease [Pseudomonadota bacterium]
MGSIVFDQGTLADLLSETVGYKAGLALSIEEICDHLSGSSYPDIIRKSELHGVRLRAEEYEALFYKLLHRVGYTTEEYNGDITGAHLYHKYRNTALKEYEGVTRMFLDMWPQMVEATRAAGSKSIDPRPFMLAAHKEYGMLGLQIANERLDVLDKALNLSPHNAMRYTEWNNTEELKNLFERSLNAPAFGEFLDQRFIDYLSSNPDVIGKMHWRKFEELTAEYFARQGFTVQLGPGGNDDGVDVRIWKPGSEGPAPHGIIQCKRQKDKIEKVIVKGLMADVSFEKADIGLIVTSSELSPGARSTIKTRGYPIDEVNRDGILQWLTQLRTPGTGIVRR